MSENEVDRYLDALSGHRRVSLLQLRDLIRERLPHAQEGMSYKMPTYTDEAGEMLCAMASQKQYLALYVCRDFLDDFREDLRHLNCGKGCIRFQTFDDLPLDTVKKILDRLADYQAG